MKCLPIVCCVWLGIASGAGASETTDAGLDLQTRKLICVICTYDSPAMPHSIGVPTSSTYMQAVRLWGDDKNRSAADTVRPAGRSSAFLRAPLRTFASARGSKSLIRVWIASNPFATSTQAQLPVTGGKIHTPPVPDLSQSVQSGQ